MNNEIASIAKKMFWLNTMVNVTFYFYKINMRLHAFLLIERKTFGILHKMSVILVIHTINWPHIKELSSFIY